MSKYKTIQAGGETKELATDNMMIKLSVAMKNVDLLGRRDVYRCKKHGFMCVQSYKSK